LLVMLAASGRPPRFWPISIFQRAFRACRLMPRSIYNGDPATGRRFILADLFRLPAVVVQQEFL